MTLYYPYIYIKNSVLLTWSVEVDAASGDWWRCRKMAAAWPQSHLNGRASHLMALQPPAFTRPQLAGRYLLSHRQSPTRRTRVKKMTAAPTAGSSGSWCQAGLGWDGGIWLITTTGGAGLTTSRKTLAASSRLCTNLFWLTSNILIVT